MTCILRNQRVSLAKKCGRFVIEEHSLRFNPLGYSR